MGSKNLKDAQKILEFNFEPHSQCWYPSLNTESIVVLIWVWNFLWKRTQKIRLLATQKMLASWDSKTKIVDKFF